MAGGDRDFLRQYARGSDEYVRAQPARDEAHGETVNDYLRRVGLDDSAPTGGPAPTEQQGNARTQPIPVDRQAQREQARRAREAQIAAEAEARQQQAKNGALIGKGLYAAGIAPNKAADTVERLQNWIATRPTPGGRGGMLLLLLLFGAFIIPVSQGGYTRAQLFWLTLLGRTEIDDSGAPSAPGEPGVKPVPAGEPRGHGPAMNRGTNGTAKLAAQPIPFTLPLPGAINGPALPS